MNVRKPSRKRTLSTCPSSVFITRERTCSAATRNRLAPILRAAIEHAHRVGLEFTLPWHQALLGYVHALNGEFESAILLLETALERSREIHLPYLASSTAALLGATLAPLDARRALDVAETALGVARASGFRALEAELLRVKAAALLSLDVDAAEIAANEGYKLAEELALGPEQGHGLRTLGDIMAAKGDAMKAEELYGLARSQFRSLGIFPARTDPGFRLRTDPA